MILEYCEEGNLRDWLLRNNDRVGDEVVEKLFQIIDYPFGIFKLFCERHLYFIERNVIVSLHVAV
jgi:hypothetical protein